MKDDRIYLLHVRDAIQLIMSYTATGKESFFPDRKTQDAVVRNLEIIGEASKRVSVTLKEAHPDIAWKPIAGMRDKLITIISESICNWCGMRSNEICRF